MKSFRQTFRLSRRVINQFVRRKLGRQSPPDPDPTPVGADASSYYMLFGIPVSSGTD